ncbi:MAG TPA: O-antigen ligase family protein [Gemmataceae bacterium]|nr:O-antigen ligase family protein [Gemmataceae bacterium]
MNAAAPMTADSPHEAPSASIGFYAELSRRILLGLTVALLSARMLAPGEDPGMMLATSGPTGLLMPMLWFLGAVVWTGWRMASRGGDWRGGLIEAALLLAGLLVFVPAEMAGYKHPARIIAWDWLTLFIVVCLVRQLAASPSDRQGLFAVFLAGAAALSAQAVYQAAVRAPASATFAQPAPFIAWLMLFLPGLFIAHIVCHLRRRIWLTLGTGLMAILGASAVGLAFAGVRLSGSVEPPLMELWAATGRMILARPLGVGPGNFSRAYPMFQPPGGQVSIADPHNFVLEIAATCGVAVLLMVLIALGAFFVKAVRWLRKPVGAAELETSERTRWEFYVGGMVGLVLGFIIRQTTGDRTPEAILMEGFVACGRCLVWLTAFVVFERVPWSGRVRAGALAAGVAAVLLTLMIGPGAGMPSIVAPLWAAVALALNEMPQREYPRINRLALTRILPFFAAAAVTLVYFLSVFMPVTSCSDKVQQAVLARKSVQGKDAGAYAEALEKRMRPALAQAAKDDPGDSRPRVLLAGWGAEFWILRPRISAEGALFAATDVEKLDPQNPEGYYACYYLRMGFGKVSVVNYQTALGAAIGSGYHLVLQETRWHHPLGRGATEKYRDLQVGDEPAYQYLEAAKALEKYLPYDPNDAVLRFLLAEALFKAWEDGPCREQAAEALRIDAAAARPPLTDEQRQKLHTWKDLPAAK